MRLLLANPNTSGATTAAMLAVAREAAPDGMAIEGVTAQTGSALIIDDSALALAAEATVALLQPSTVQDHAGVIVAAFGDPGLDALRRSLGVPVTGIAEAAMAEAAAQGRFVVVTTTPGLVDAIGRTAARYGHAGLFGGVRLTTGDPRILMQDPALLVAALAAACAAAVHDGAAAIVIGGGPLATAARALRGHLPVPLVEPIPAAVRLAAWRGYGVLSR